MSNGPDTLAEVRSFTSKTDRDANEARDVARQLAADAEERGFVEVVAFAVDGDGNLVWYVSSNDAIKNLGRLDVIRSLLERSIFEEV